MSVQQTFLQFQSNCNVYRDAVSFYSDIGITVVTVVGFTVIDFVVSPHRNVSTKYLEICFCAIFETNNIEYTSTKYRTLFRH